MVVMPRQNGYFELGEERAGETDSGLPGARGAYSPGPPAGSDFARAVPSEDVVGAGAAPGPCPGRPGRVPGTGRAPVGSTCPHCRARATPAVGIFWKRESPRDPGGLLDNAHWRQGLGRATADGAGAPDPSVSDGQGLGATRVHCLDPSTINKVHRERRLKQPLAHGRRGEKPPS